MIENVPGSPLENSLRLCGTSFGLPLRRHRYFEISVFLMTLSCAHGAYPKVWEIAKGDPRNRSGKYTHSRFVGVYGSTHRAGEDAERRFAMGIDWMTRYELTQAIPPAYTEFIGEQLLAHVRRAA